MDMPLKPDILHDISKDVGTHKLGGVLKFIRHVNLTCFAALDLRSSTARKVPLSNRRGPDNA